MKLIINADDCGISRHVNEEIEKCIIEGKITSTTIMANMDDFEGAVKLYDKYKNQVSFGWHINLDQGEALTRSQLLLDKGFFIEKDNKILLNGSSFGKSVFSLPMRNEIKRELRTQWEKISDNGISITHADSHHFIHTQPSMIQIMPSLFKELNIRCCRHVANYGAKGMNYIARMVWSAIYRMNGFKMPDTFCSFSQYLNYKGLKQGDVIELMVHPGHPDKAYDNEYKSMMSINYTDIWPNAHLINYKYFI